MWYAGPICNEKTKVKIANIVKLCPGLTRYSKSHVNELKDAFLLFFPPSIENLILDNSNCYGRAIHGDKHIEIDSKLLHAYLAVLILSGALRYPIYYFFHCFKISFTRSKKEKVCDLYNAEYCEYLNCAKII